MHSSLHVRKYEVVYCNNIYNHYARRGCASFSRSVLSFVCAVAVSMIHIHTYIVYMYVCVELYFRYDVRPEYANRKVARARFFSKEDGQVVCSCVFHVCVFTSISPS